MKQMSLTTIAIGASTFACAALLSFGWSEQRGVSLSVENAQARVGRPLTPVSAAGVARRHTRRAVYGAGADGAGAAAAGTAAAIGTAAAVGATSPYYTGAGYYAGSPYYGGRSNYGGGPYYGGPIRGAGAAYYGGVSSSDHATYIKNLHDSGYDAKNNFDAKGILKTQ
jgi:hypothetical protein